MASSALPPSGGVAPLPRRTPSRRPSRAVRRWALAAAAVASLVAWGLVGLSSLAAGQAPPPATPVVDDDVNPGPCLVSVLIQCLCTDPRVFIDGELVEMQPALDVNRTSSFGAQMLISSNLTVAVLVEAADASTFGMALRVTTTARPDASSGTPSIGGIFWTAALVDSDYHTSGMQPVPEELVAMPDITPPPGAPAPAPTLFQWREVEVGLAVSDEPTVALRFERADFVREVTDIPPTAPYYVGFRAPDFPRELCVGAPPIGEAPVVEVPAPLPNAPNIAGSADDGTPRAVPVTSGPTHHLLKTLWSFIGSVTFVSLAYGAFNTHRLWHLSWDEPMQHSSAVGAPPAIGGGRVFGEQPLDGRVEQVPPRAREGVGGSPGWDHQDVDTPLDGFNGRVVRAIVSRFTLRGEGAERQPPHDQWRR
ncbi:hypothetical protein BU14_0152s0039 [Porphyra umbilicalis]|uniref:Uncharacterized protein n=1 Tax=Porphyra umbilicalis TaxID=2786 RepID=A0A1X6P911_PORUM|nr:hypothetical protein BU14_0152s0039 [Porphyra umbilicalis]|eukprot:OSX77344.1 hypothetical protein BU14_0152s0039 [Porphyra umbilicalis]